MRFNSLFVTTSLLRRSVWNKASHLSYSRKTYDENMIEPPQIYYQAYLSGNEFDDHINHINTYPNLTSLGVAQSSLLSKVSPNALTGLTSLIIGHPYGKPVLKDLAAIRDNCRSLEQLQIQYAFTPMESYQSLHPMFLDIVNQNPNLLLLVMPPFEGILNVLKTRCPKLKQIYFNERFKRPSNDNILQQIGELFSSAPSMVNYETEEVVINLQDEQSFVKISTYDFKVEDTKQLLSLFTNCSIKLDFSYTMDSFVQEILNVPGLSTRITNIAVPYYVTITTLMRLFKICSSVKELTFMIPLTEIEFDEVFQHMPQSVESLKVESVSEASAMKLLKSHKNLKQVLKKTSTIM